MAALLHNIVAKLDSKSDEFSRDDTRQYVMVRGLCFRCATELLSSTILVFGRLAYQR